MQQRHVDMGVRARHVQIAVGIEVVYLSNILGVLCVLHIRNEDVLHY